ncbi:MAG: peptidase M4 family protein [Propionibacteriales bacterium]|nr:peptidase M4 family protein [Propionibacteriales bacterium]
MTRCHIIPPFILSRLAEQTDDDEVRGYARSTLELDDAIRTRRRQRGSRPSGATQGDRPDRAIHDARNTRDLPGELVRAEGDDPTGDEAVDEAYDGSGLAWTLFREDYERDSYDGDGHRISATVHYERNYANAFWDGEQLVFGDGDGRIFQRFTKAPDVVVHEFTHAVTEHTAGLLYEGQSGALNESVSDVFAVLAVQKANDETADEASWLIGEGLFTENVNATALRSMKEPGTAYDDPLIGTDPQPGHMDDYVETEEDNGGVHINSGIPNRAFHLAATGIGGHAWEQAGWIWYATLTDPRLEADADFARFAELTLQVAEQLFGPDSTEARAVRDAWSGVGVEVVGAPAPSPGGHRVAVRRTGGFAGIPVDCSLDTGTAPNGREIDELLAGIDLDTVEHSSTPRPDGYAYAIDVDGRVVTLYEHDLTPDLRALVDLVLSSGS